MLTALMMFAAWQPLDQPIILAEPPVAAAAADDWRRIASTATRAYFVNMGGRAIRGEVTEVVVASVPTAADAGQGHLRDHYEVRCASGDYRVIRSVDVADDGAEDVLDDAEAAWEPVPEDGLIIGVKELACGEGVVAEGYPSLEAFMASRD